MTMGLLAPWFLLGAAAIAVPFWLHRLQAQSAERRKFSSTMLLETSEQRVHVRRRLRYLLLLASRVLLLALAIIAFAQPFLERPPKAGAVEAGTSIIVIDTSASMGRSGVFEQAIEAATGIVDDAPGGVALQVAAAGGTLRPAHEPTSDKGAARRALDELRPEAVRMDVGQLAREIGTLAKSATAPVTVHIVSDFQSSAMPARFADAIPPGVGRLVPYPVGTGDPVNWSVTFVRRAGAGVEVGVHAWGLTDGAADVELTINGARSGVRSVTGSGPHVVAFDEVLLQEGDNRALVAVRANDDLDADNRYYAVIPNHPPAPVLLLTGDTAGLPATYITTALESAGESSFDVLALSWRDVEPRVLGRYRWVIVDGLLGLDARLAASLHDYAAGGGNLLAFAGQSRGAPETMPVGGQRLGPAALVARPDRYRSVGQVDTRHPALSGTSGWHRLNVGPGPAIEPSESDRVLVRLDDGSPYVVEQRIGSGLLLTVFDALDNRASDLPVHAVFVGFMLDAAGYLAGRTSRVTSLVTGETASPGSGGGQVVAPDGSTLLELEATARPRPVRLEDPGIYEIHSGDDVFLVAANIDARESDLDPIDQVTLDLWRDSTYAETTAGAGGVRAGAAAAELQLWPWLLLALVLAAIVESVLANHRLAAGTGVSL